ncbi:MAG: carbon monoxide dehydrogenase subunit G [Gemmatimonadales bacterium]|jgi:carbon monoxide dehydrogenase subunit G|nr:MAG: carbon monoxide dehydrogenase subunit G [Gemmatimonadales bacterium]
MKVGGDYTFDGPQQLVWDTFLDPEVLAGVLPGCEKLELVGENEYEGALKIKIGPVQGQFLGKVKLEDIQPPDAYTMQVDGRGAPGFVKATGHLKLQPSGDQTLVTYEGDAQVGGRLASVGQRLVESSAKAIIKQSLDGLNAAVKARSAAAEAGEDAPAPTPVAAPSQAEFAATVAKEVAKDLLPTWARYGLFALVVLVILYVVFSVLT